MNNKIATIWISGVTASGKTTLGKILHQELKNTQIENIKFLDGEDLRKIQNRVYGHSLEERFKVIKNYIKIVQDENKKGNIVIISTVSHKKKMRDLARGELVNFFEVNLLCNVEACATRDYKNLYNSIDKDSKECFPGVTEPYEISKNAELILDTAKFSIEELKTILFTRTLAFLNGGLFSHPIS